MIESASLWPLIEARAAATPDEPMAVDARDRAISFGDYHDAAIRVARGLANNGVGPGEIVSWMLPTRLESLLLVGALARLGCIQNPILPIYREREVRFIAEQCRPRLLVTPSEWRGFDYAEMARGVARDVAGLECLVVDEALPEASSEATEGELPPAPGSSGMDATDEEDPVRWLFYTSGTTSDPKGVRHSDATLWAGALGMLRALELESRDQVAFVFPLTHIGGINWLQAGLAAGCRLILIENFAEKTTMPTLRRHGMTLGTAGTVFHEAYLKAHRDYTAEHEGAPLFPDVRAFPGGGAPKPPKLHADLRRELGGVGIASGYGLTEAPILSMSRVDDEDEKLAQTEGRSAGHDVDLRVVDLEGRPCRPGEDGEFVVRAPQLFRGYVDAALDAQAFDANGYFRTGDLGHLDADGYVVVTGRRKDVIIRKGENISAREIEDLLYAHPKVEDVAVIGLPDAESGERCCAVVVCADPGEPLDMEEMGEFLRSKDLMLQKIPEQLELVDSIPRNATGKVSKHLLRERFGG